MKRLSAVLLSFMLLCAAAAPAYAEGSAQGPINIVCTIFPQYDWVRQILGDRANDMELTLLLDNKIDLHSYQPSVEDIIRISECDLFIYVGGESDAWVEDVLKQAANPDMVIINLVDAMGDAIKTEELKEGMEPEEHDHGGEAHEEAEGEVHEEDEHAQEDHADEDHSEEANHPEDEAHAEEDHADEDHPADEEHAEDEEHHEGEDHDHEEETVYDEHVWLSLKNAQVLCSAIADTLSAMDPDHAEAYQSNLTAYIAQLAALDAEYESALSAAPVKTLLFGDRFPFRYLVDDYGLDYFAAFVGCSAETEASFQTIIFLAEKMDELSLHTVMVTESSDQRIAETVIRESTAKDQQILVLDAIQSISADDVAGGLTYLSVMEKNLTVLKEALQ